MTASPRDRVAIALDVPTLDEATSLAARLASTVGWFKVGLELFAAHGPEAVTSIGRHGRVFLDLKLHDIPTTVGRATERIAALDVGLLTVHALGGPRMIAAAAESMGDSGRVVAVTVLTSHDAAELDQLGLPGTATYPTSLAGMAVSAGAHGVVCAPGSARSVRDAVGTDATIVTPGVRLDSTAVDDHAGVASPIAAITAGADLLVVGRPVTRAEDPVAVAEQIVSTLG